VGLAAAVVSSAVCATAGAAASNVRAARRRSGVFMEQIFFLWDVEVVGYKD
jgi:hypothetical protein